MHLMLNRKMDNRSVIELEALLITVKEKWVLPLEKDKRFINRSKLLGKFYTHKSPQIINELILANLILNNSQFECKTLEYESVSLKTDKSIDFYYETLDGTKVFCDVKTIQPEMKDAWAKFREEQKYFPPNVCIDLEPESMGGEIYHNMRSARSSMLKYALECEEKISVLKVANMTHFILIFCGNGFHWHLDELEDFADFYFTGKHNPDDQFAAMESNYMGEKEIVFKRDISRFGYLERKEYETNYRQIVCPVQGPWITGRYKEHFSIMK